MEFVSIADCTNKCISGCIEELSALTTRVNDGVEPRRLAVICDCEDNNGFANIIALLGMAFRNKVAVNTLDSEGDKLLYKLDETWGAFLSAIEPKVSNRKYYVALRDAIRNLREPLRKAYCGQHVEDEDKRLGELKTALQNLSEYFASQPSNEDKKLRIMNEMSHQLSIVVSFVTRLKDRFWHVFGVHKNLSVEEARAALGDDERYLQCFAKCKMKEPHKSQVIAVVRWTHHGHPLDHEATQGDIQNHTAYTINHAAREVMDENVEKWRLLKDAWSDPKLLADACRGFMGKDNDPFMYKK